MHYLYTFMFLCHHGKGLSLVVVCRQQILLGPTAVYRVVLVGITGQVNCKNVRRDFRGFNRVLNLTST